MNRNICNTVGGDSRQGSSKPLCDKSSNNDHRINSHVRQDVQACAKKYDDYNSNVKKILSNDARSPSTVLNIGIAESTGYTINNGRNANKNRGIEKSNFYDQYQQYANYYYEAKKEITELKHELYEVNYQNEKMANDNKKLMDSYYITKDDFERLKMKNNELSNAAKAIPELEINIDELNNVMDDTLEKNKNLTNENSNLKNQISELNGKFQSTQESFELECKQLKSEIDNLKKHFSKPSYPLEDLSSTVAKLEKEKNEICNEARERISVLETFIKGLELHIKKLDEEKITLLAENNRSSHRIITDSSSFASLPQLRDNIGVSNSKVSKSKSKEENDDSGLKYNSEENIKLIDELTQVKYKCHNYRKKYNEYKSLNEKLKAGNSNYEEEIVQLKEKLNEMTLYSREVSNLNTEKAHRTTRHIENKKYQEKTLEIQSNSPAQNTLDLEIKIMSLEEANQKYVLMIAEKDLEIQKKKEAILIMHDKFKSNKTGNEELEKLNQYKIQMASQQKQLDCLKEQFDQLTDLYRDTTVQFEVSKKLNNELKAEINNMKLLQFANKSTVPIQANDEIFQEKNTTYQDLKVKVTEQFPSWWSDHMKPVSIEDSKLKECPNCNRTISADSMNGHIKLCMDI